MNVQLETSLKVILIKKPRSINIREEKTPKKKQKRCVTCLAIGHKKGCVIHGESYQRKRMVS